MRIQYFSDIHIDHSLPGGLNIQAKHIVGDVLVVAGDLTDGKWETALKFLKGVSLAGVPIVFVLGNHEFFGSNFPTEAPKELKQSLNNFPNIFVLEKESLIVHGVRFLGTTLWTKFENSKDGEAAERFLPEYASMTTEQGDPVTWKTVVKEHRKSLEWLRKSLYETFDGPTIVVTHHAPSFCSVDSSYYGHRLNGAFFSDLDAFIVKTNPTAWIHGHTHASKDYVIGETRIVCNPLGYEDSCINKNFLIEKTLEI